MAAGLIAQCPNCRALVMVSAIVVDGSTASDGSPRAGLSCSACGAVSWLPQLVSSSSAALSSSSSAVSTALPSLASLAAPSSTPELVPAMLPPSTALVMPAAPTTALAASFDPETLTKVRARFTIEPNEGQGHLAERFEKLLDGQWANEAEHKVLLKAAAAAGELAFVGNRYRAVLDVVRDEPRARAAQQELLTLAMATMSTQRSNDALDKSPGSGKLVLAVLVVAAIGGGVFVLMRILMSSLAGGLGGDAVQ
jgi:hypothetical protein